MLSDEDYARYKDARFFKRAAATEKDPSIAEQYERLAILSLGQQPQMPYDLQNVQVGVDDLTKPIHEPLVVNRQTGGGE